MASNIYGIRIGCLAKNYPRFISARALTSSSVKLKDTGIEQNAPSYDLPHPIWTRKDVNNVEKTHFQGKGFVDNCAYGTVWFLRRSFDLASGYTIKKWLGTLDERDMLRRCIFLETIAGVPGFAAAMMRHLYSLRYMETDHDLIHTLLEEAENERMHLFTFLQLRKPGPILRGAVWVSQFVFTGWFCIAYFVSRHYCHRFVGYLEEQAVITYSDILQAIDDGKLPMWSKLPAPPIAVSYWKLTSEATMRDVILMVRADEAHHRNVNHDLGNDGTATEVNKDEANDNGVRKEKEHSI